MDEGRGYVDLQAVPGSPKSFAVAVDPQEGVNLSVWDDGVRRNGTGAVGSKIHFSSPMMIYGDGGDSLFEDTLAPGQVNWTGQTSLNVGGMDYADGKIFTAQGNVYDAVSKTLTMTFPTTDFLVDKVLTASSSDNRVYYVTWAVDHGKRVLSFDKTTGVEMPPVETGVTVGGAQQVVACGNHTAVFQVFGSGVKRTPYIVRELP